MLMNEIFNSSVPLTWEETQTEACAKFTIKDKQYVLRITPHLYEFHEKTYTFLNVAFSRILENGNETMDLTLDRSDASLVLGAVINGAAAKIKYYQADALLLVATNNTERRMKIYMWIARQFHGTFGILTPIITLPKGKAIALLSSDIPKHVQATFNRTPSAGDAPQQTQRLPYLSSALILSLSHS